MKVIITLNLSDEDRRAVRRYYGNDGLATRAEAASLCEALVKADLQSLYPEGDEGDGQ